MLPVKRNSNNAGSFITESGNGAEREGHKHDDEGGDEDKVKVKRRDVTLATSRVPTPLYLETQNPIDSAAGSAGIAGRDQELGRGGLGVWVGYACCSHERLPRPSAISLSATVNRIHEDAVRNRDYPASASPFYYQQCFNKSLKISNEKDCPANSFQSESTKIPRSNLGFWVSIRFASTPVNVWVHIVSRAVWDNVPQFRLSKWKSALETAGYDQYNNPPVGISHGLGIGSDRHQCLVIDKRNVICLCYKQLGKAFGISQHTFPQMLGKPEIIRSTSHLHILCEPEGFCHVLSYIHRADSGWSSSKNKEISEGSITGKAQLLLSGIFFYNELV
ncbi:hypothetical protein BU17DRAFT_70626 [Hysterangium stoloniferum]|nr:hypothetical protein BU17DRAFT_70626 [Hysterangium stoloniferum]